jgi:hypothetical protein
MTEDQSPFEDVQDTDEGFTLPELKWRELVFIGALRPESGAFVRDQQRPMPAFKTPNLFPDGARFEVHRLGGRVHLKRV